MFVNDLTVHVSVSGESGLSLRTLVHQVSPSGRASTGEARPASAATSPVVMKHQKPRWRQLSDTEESQPHKNTDKHGHGAKKSA